MKKIIVFPLMLLASVLMVTAAVAQKARTIKIGINAEITGDIPKVGEATKFAAQMYVEDVNKAGGIEVGGKKYMLELAVEDNESKAESAAKAATKLITVDEVIAIVGPQASKQAVPAGEVCNNYKTPMISGWSTNPNTTKDRPYVFRACFLSTSRGRHCRSSPRRNTSSKRRPCSTMWPATTPRDWPSSSRRTGKRSTGPARL